MNNLRIRKSHSDVFIGADVVIKTGSPELMKIEIAKTQKAYEIAKSSGLFRVPKVVDFDERCGKAVFERLDIVPFASAAWGAERTDLAQRLGHCLAEIHKNLKLPAELSIELPSAFDLNRDKVFLHGDLSVNNVCYSVSTKELVLIDWQMTPLFGGRSTYGCCYFDLMWFVGDLINRPFVRFLYSNPVAPVAAAFLESYFEVSKAQFDSNDLRRYAKRFFGETQPPRREKALRRKLTRSRLVLTRSEKILDDFLGSLF